MRNGLRETLVSWIELFKKVFKIGYMKGAQATYYSPNNKRILVRYPEGEGRTFEVTSGQLLGEIPLADSKDVVFSPDSEILLIEYKGDFGIFFQVDTGQPLGRFSTGDYEHIYFSPGNRFAFIMYADKSGSLFEIETGRKLFDVPLEGFLDIQSSPFSTTLMFVRYEEGRCLFYDTVAGQKLSEIPVEKLTDHSFYFEFERIFIEHPEGTIQLFDAPLQGVADMIFCPDGRTVLVAYADKTGIFFEIATGKQLSELSFADFDTLTFSYDTKRITVSYTDGTTVVIDSQTGERFYEVPH